MRLIDADALKKQIEDFHCNDCDNYNFVRCGACHIDDAISYLDEAPTIGGWISVKDELPEENKEVLAYTGTYMFIAAYTTNPTKYWYTISGSAMRAVTHWMPLPEPPKENE